jgi:hypothetical protein
MPQFRAIRPNKAAHRLEAMLRRDKILQRGHSAFDPAIWRHAEHLHRCGARAVYKFLREVLAGAEVRDRLDAYARIDPAILHYLSGDRPPVFAERVR